MLAESLLPNAKYCSCALLLHACSAQVRGSNLLLPLQPRAGSLIMRS